MQIAFGMIITGYIYVIQRDGFTWNSLIKVLILMGFVMRIGYMLYTPAKLRGHDLNFYGEGQKGHFQYIYLLYSKGHLPTTNAGQFYHPPLFHILAAFCMRLVHFLTGINDPAKLIEAGTVVSCIASCMTLRVVDALCEEVQLKEVGRTIAISMVAFLPNMYLLAGRVNNDALVIFFMVWILLLTIRWYKNSNWLQTILLALAFGLGVMTKVSCAVIAAFTAGVMLVKFVKELKQGRQTQILVKLLTFGCISLPIGLWYPIRNYVKFGQKLTYVLPIKGAESDLYVGHIPFVKRFLLVPWSEATSTIYNDPLEDYNCINYLIKGSLFGEFQFSITTFIPKLLLVMKIILLLASLTAFIYHIIIEIGAIRIDRKSKKKVHRIENQYLSIGFPIVWLLIIGSYFLFNLRYPFGCSMDFRYVVPTVVLEAISLGYMIQSIQQRVKEVKGCKSVRFTIGRGFIVTMIFTTILFSILSIVMFTNIAE